MSNSIIIAGGNIPAITQSINTPYQVTAPILDAPLDRPGLLFLQASGVVEFVGVNDEVESAEAIELQAGETGIYVKQINSAGTAIALTDLFIIPATPLVVARDSTVPTDITIAELTIDEENSIDDVVGEITVNDPDVGDTHTLTLLTNYRDGSKFEIDGTDLVIKEVANFKAKPSYVIKIRVEDEQGNTIDKEFTITVNAINHAPTDILLSSANLQEGNVSGAFVGFLAGVDPDNDPCTFSLIAGTGDTDNADFSIVGRELFADFVADYGVKNSYSIRVQASDGTDTFAKAFTINIIEN